MSASVPQNQLEQRVLVALYEYSQTGDQRLSAEEVQALLQGDFGKQRVELALNALENADLIYGSYAMNSPSRFSITEAGYKQVEEAYFARLEAAEEEQVAADPIEHLEQQIAPAAGRMVSFGDNQQSKQDVIAKVEQAEEIVRSSNSLDVGEKEDVANNLSSWRSLVEKTKIFAVGAFKFLVWDRLKSVIEGGIENVYKTLLSGILITLGTVIVSLL